jgi:predicted deacetylase
MLGRARYLVRFDDICPGMNWPTWRAIEKILIDADVRPLLAVVPDNQDAKLDVGPREPRFWDFVRGWQGRGWTIGLHGYQHRYVTREAGLVGINPRSEFAGLPAIGQADKLRRAVAIFRDEGVRPEVWIAPGHSFDTATVAALHEVGITAISDGFFLDAHRDGRGTLWVPQQLWSFRFRPLGLWTVCYHHNAWGASELGHFAADVASYRSRITTFAAVASAPHVRGKSWHDDWVATLMSKTRTVKSLVKGALRGGSRQSPG